ncbi:RNA-directed DNA polymerase from mobile element jockey [Nephila pilipes]|uniref:RNA-directed DNA polymerase from mobile element jockey n=1 Tax=Nephila pilipes TaxID=299642 RepID=A0A8X6IDR8_NEPPI|nr:RNA-directed DNA polymerase from mobile element jockey [Nephila pilipes]
MDDKEFMMLNDGSPTHSSFSYNTHEALHISITSADNFPNTSVLDHIGSDQFPILIKFRKRQRVFINRDKFWNFKKPHLDSFREAVDTCLTTEPMTVNLTHSWTIFKKTVLDKARSNIQGINVKNYVPYFAHNTSTLSPILEKRKRLLETFSDTDNYKRTELSKINAELKLAYAHLKRERWKEMCSKIDPTSSDSKPRK